jgi:hypothetical protein
MGGIALFLLRNWKIIAVGIVIAGLVSALIGFGMRYQSLKDSKDTLQSQITNLEATIQHKNISIKDRDDSIFLLNNANEKREKDLNRYMQLYKNLQKNTDIVQKKYNEMLEKINNAKIPIMDGVIVEPYIVIPSGVPKEAIGF